MQQRLQTTPECNASIKVKHLINNCKLGRKMLWGLPLSKELGRWSGHSGSSSTSSSSASVTSCGCTSSCSLGSSGMTTGLSVCDPVWCRCVSAYAKGASDEMNTMNILVCKVVTSSKNMYYKHMSSIAFSSTTNMLSQHISLNASKIHQSFTNFLIMHKATFD